jgi:hypothetical protein
MLTMEDNFNFDKRLIDRITWQCGGMYANIWRCMTMDGQKGVIRTCQSVTLLGMGKAHAKGVNSMVHLNTIQVTNHGILILCLKWPKLIIRNNVLVIMKVEELGCQNQSLYCMMAQVLKGRSYHMQWMAYVVCGPFTRKGFTPSQTQNLYNWGGVFIFGELCLFC